MSRIVVIGHGMAGARFVQELRARDRQREHSVTVLSAERETAYNRILLSSVLAGKLTAEDVETVPSAWYAAEDVDLRTGVVVTRIDRTRRRVVTADGECLPYDHLVLATGSSPWVPPVDGLVRHDGELAEGVVAFRTLDDCRSIIRRIQVGDGSGIGVRAQRVPSPVRRAVVLGGGLLGLEAARGLAGRGVDVTVVHPMDRLMERQLDRDAGRVLRRTIQDLGVRVRLNARAVAFRRGTAVVLDDGSTVAADLVIVACGVRPNVLLARQAGLAVDQAVMVGDRLTSVTDPHVHAIGECAQHRDQVYGLVAPAWEQAAVLADVLTGGDTRYAGSQIVTRLKAAGVDLAAMGDADLDERAAGDDEYEVVCFADPSRGTYQKIVIRDDRVTGAIMLGDAETVGVVTQLYDRSALVPRDRRALIFPGVLDAGGGSDVADLPDEAVVCRCNSVSCGDVRSVCAAGARDVDDVADATRATTGCGSCRRDIQALLNTRQPEGVPA